MKTINETFTDEEHYLLVKKKEKQSWHDFILMLTKKGGKQKMKVRKKPIVVEAVQWDGTNFDEVKELDKSSHNKEYRKIFHMKNNLKIRTIEGDMMAVLGDWIIRGVKGELYPCKPDVFDKTYDIVKEKLIKKEERKNV